MIYNLTKRTSLVITFVVDVVEKPKKVECVFLLQDDLFTWK